MALCLRGASYEYAVLFLRRRVIGSQLTALNSNPLSGRMEGKNGCVESHSKLRVTSTTARAAGWSGPSEGCWLRARCSPAVGEPAGGVRSPVVSVAQ